MKLGQHVDKESGSDERGKRGRYAHHGGRWLPAAGSAVATDCGFNGG